MFGCDALNIRALFVWNPLAQKPALDRRVISMAQLASRGANASQPLEKFDVGHSVCVHTLRTQFKPYSYTSSDVACGRTDTHNAPMADESTGERLKRIQERSGRSYSEIAKAAGLAGRSSVQRYFSAEFDGALSATVAKNLVAGLAGTPIDPNEIWELAEPMPNVAPAPSARLETDQRDLPIYGTALGAPIDFGGVAVEQTELQMSEVIDRYRRPSALRGRADAYGVYIQGSSMAPRFQEGEVAFVDPKRPPQVGDDVLVFIASPEDEGERITACLIKRLVRRTAEYIELEQFNPGLAFKIERGRVKNVHRVIPWAELLA